MIELQRTHDSIPPNAAPAGPGGEGLAAVQKKLQAVLAAGAGVIDTTLSGDSAAYLKETKQRGGQ